MEISVKIKPNSKVYYVSNNTIFKLTCEHISIYSSYIEYYFYESLNNFKDEDFGVLLFTDYNLACDALEDYRKEMLNE